MSAVSVEPLTRRSPAAVDDEFRMDVLRGLSSRPKTLPCKYFYDQAGSLLFEQICQQPEYYPTRSELAIMQRHAAEMATLLGPDCLLVEYGSGTSAKTRLLLNHLPTPAAYVPVDIAAQQIRESGEALRLEYPDLNIRPVCADFTQPLDAFLHGIPARRRVVYFPGSTIGNFAPGPAVSLLRQTAELCGPGGVLLLGADLKKDPRILETAYNDGSGVTAAFNLNLLARVNRQLGARFDLQAFWHHACYLPTEGRIEMHLVSRRDQQTSIDDHGFFFAEGEAICTEYSYKYSLADLHTLAGNAGFAIQRIWMDERKYFSVSYLAVS
jgi:dimethylhistidine N-methyltransferase